MKLSVQLHNYGENRQLLLTRDVTTVAQADAMRRDFVANVSHEIRTPLTVMSGFIETLQSLNLDKEERERYLDLMAVQAGRMQDLVNDLLILSQLEGSTLPAINVLSEDSIASAAETQAGHHRGGQGGRRGAVERLAVLGLHACRSGLDRRRAAAGPRRSETAAGQRFHARGRCR